VGTISSAGLYTAAASVSAAQDVNVTATSVADSTKSATATVVLIPTISVTSVLQETISVGDFGAVGDGVADDTAAIQLAVTAAGGGGAVFFPQGTYKVSVQTPIIVPDNVRIYGIGDGSVIKMTGVTHPSTSNDTEVVFSISGGHVTIDHLQFLGENGVGASGYDSTIHNQSSAVFADVNTSHDIVVENCYFSNLYGYSVEHMGGGVRHYIRNNRLYYNASHINDNADYSYIIGNNFDHAAGIEASGSYLTVAQNTMDYSGLVGDDTAGALNVGGRTSVGSYGPGVRVIGNTVIDAYGSGIVVSDGVSDSVVANNTVTRGNGAAGIVIAGWINPPLQIVIDGNTVNSFGRSGQIGFGIGIEVVGAAQNLTISNNIVTDNAISGQDMQEALVMCEGVLPPSGVSIEGNLFRGTVWDIHLNHVLNVWIGINDYRMAYYFATSNTTFSSSPPTQ
jgi:hypothetical protein